jgi:hypothetical protein
LWTDGFKFFFDKDLTHTNTFTASRSEKMKKISADSNNWQVFRISGRRAAERSNTLAGQKKKMNGDGLQCECDLHGICPGFILAEHFAMASVYLCPRMPA